MRRAPWIAAGAALAVVAGWLGAGTPPAPVKARLLPPPAAFAEQGQQVAVLAGGCFWGMEGLFEHVRGVTGVVSGYAAHDPTQVERQHPDEGPSYRSAVFPQNPAQRAAAAAYIAALNKARAFGKPLATRIEGGAFFPAERSHQDFMLRNPGHPYIQAWDVPRLKRLRATFPARYKG